MVGTSLYRYPLPTVDGRREGDMLRAPPFWQ
jgi:hypothetical protein